MDASRLSHRLARALAKAYRNRPPRTSAGTSRGAAGLLDWAREFLPAHFTKPPSAMHEWLADELDQMRVRRGKKVNLIGPRGGAKSTVATLAFALRSAVEGDEPYIWIVSDTKRQAENHLHNLVSEIVDNPRLADAYPVATGKGDPWRRSSATLRNGVVIDAYGAGQRVRGHRRRADRPTLIICDDLQNEQHITSAHQRNASFDWFHGTLLKAGSPRTNIVNVATALHRDALAMRLHKTPGWRSELFRSINRWPTNTGLWDQWERIYCDAEEQDAPATADRFYVEHRADMDLGAEVLWPEEESLYTLMKMRVESGAASFDREKQGSPIDPTRCEWPDSYFDDHAWFDDWPTDLVLKTMALDPSKGVDSRHGDYSAIVMLGVDTRGVLYVEADLARRPTPTMVSDTVDHYLSFDPEAFGVEANQWQQLLCGEFIAEFQRRGLLGVAPCEVNNYTPKSVRIRRLGPYLSQRRLRFFRGSESTEVLVDQLRDFPLGTHDDGPDSLEMALRLAEEFWRGRRTTDGLGDRLPVG